MRRLLDPGTSTRRTAGARQRLADHPLTAALLDAGLHLLLDHPGPEGPDGAEGAADLPSRFFDVLSAARVSSAATRLGPLRTTPAHMRDRWPRRGDFAADLLAYGRSELHGAAVRRAVDRAGTGGAPGPDAGPELVARDLALRNVHSGRTAALHRLQLLAAALAPGLPDLGAALWRDRVRFEAVSTASLATVLARAGLEPVPGTDGADLVAALHLLTEGANLRLMAEGEGRQARAGALDAVARAGLLLSTRWWRPAGRAAGPAAPPAADPAGVPPQSRPDLADVLTRLTDPASGTRRTEEGRRRLAQDDVTRQLLEGGVAVLTEEFGLARSDGGAQRDAPGRVFDGLSAARVVARARADGGAGAEATVARLRDRWPVQDHYLDDLAVHALSRHRPAAQELLALAEAGTPAGPALHGEVAGATARRLAAAEVRRAARLKVLVLVLARTRHGVAEALAELNDHEHQQLRGLLEAQLAAYGTRLREGTTLDELTRWTLALDDGALVRALVTGAGAGGADDDEGPALLVRSVVALVDACTVPGTGTA